MDKEKALQMVHSFIALHPEYEGDRSSLKVFVEFLDFMGLLDLHKTTAIGSVTLEDENLARKRYLDNE